MGLRSIQYNDATQILTVVFSNGTNATFDYGAYVAANTPTKNAMVQAARTTIRDNGGLEDADVSLTILNGRPFLKCKFR
jgi:hypothetical protein